MFKLNILAIMSPPLYAFMTDLLPELSSFCTVDLLEAETNMESKVIYDRKAHLYDAVVFSGRIFQLYATENQYHSKIPGFAFDDLAPDLGSILYKLIRDNRDFDFSRTSVDFLFENHDPMGHFDLFPEDQRPYCLGQEFYDYLSMDNIKGELLTQKVLQHHLLLYDEGKIDFVITRYGANTKALEARGIPHIYATPSKEYIINFFLQIVSSYNLKLVQEQLMGVISLRYLSSSSQIHSELTTRCNIALSNYARLNGYDFNFTWDVGRFEVVTRYKDLALLTDGFTSNPFDGILSPGDRPHILIGIGAGSTIFQARLNAATALSVSGTDISRIFYVSQDNRIFGPLGESTENVLLSPDDVTLDLSKRLGVDHVVLQQLKSFIRVSGKGVTDAHELSDFMGISRRTASRILTKIASAGGARVYPENTRRARGRPKMQYELLLDHRKDAI